MWIKKQKLIKFLAFSIVTMFDFTSQYQDNQPGNKDKMTYLINWLSEFEVQSNHYLNKEEHFVP